jgi:hypothetical protein
MHSATRLDDLKILECFLQNSLHAHLGRIIPFQVQCLYKDETLWVLAQHPANIAIDIPDTFNVLERALQAEEPKTPLAVKLYLRTEGNQRPYSQQGFTVYPLVKTTVPGEAGPAMTGTSEDRVALDRHHQDLTPGKPIHISADRMENADFTPSTVPEIVPNDEEVVSLATQSNYRSGYPSDRLVKLDADAFVANIEHSFGTTNKDYHSAYPPAASRGRKLLPLLGGLGALALGAGGAYMGTRPCVLSACPELSVANQLTQSSLGAIENPKATGQDVLTAQKQLHQSVDTLNSIPVWSDKYDTAQKSLQITAPLVADLDTTVAAMNKAYQATNLVKTQPVAIAQWQQSKQLWTESVGSLGTIATNSKLYPLAHQKRTDYQGRLADIDRRMEAETNADRQLKSATQGIKAAQQAQSSAVSLAQWREVKTQWDGANTQLTGIPPTTTVYPQAQALLKSVRPQMTAAQEKVGEEEKATQNYNKAVKLASSAQLMQKNKLLDRSLADWNQAVVTIQSIPPTSSIYTQAKPLIGEYTKNFQQVETQFKTTQRIAMANRDLQRTCAGNPQICSYTVSNKAIVVRLMPLYAQTLMQTALVASAQGNGNAKVGIINHVNTLGNALQAIGENAKLPIEVYGADGKQIQTYRPQG